MKGRTSVIGEELTQSERGRLRDAIVTRGLDYVGQEIVRLSTTPRWIEDKLEPRPFVLRVYCAATGDGWRVMPGGFCRISDQPDARAVSMGDGVESADVWVLAENPVEVSSLLPSPRTRPDHAVARQSAQPCSGQSVLVWTLSRTRRGDASCRSLPERPFGGSGRTDARRPAIARPSDGRPASAGARSTRRPWRRDRLPPAIRRSATGPAMDPPYPLRGRRETRHLSSASDLRNRRGS